MAIFNGKAIVAVRVCMVMVRETMVAARRQSLLAKTKHRRRINESDKRRLMARVQVRKTTTVRATPIKSVESGLLKRRKMKKVVGRRVDWKRLASASQ